MRHGGLFAGGLLILSMGLALPAAAEDLDDIDAALADDDSGPAKAPAREADAEPATEGDAPAAEARADDLPEIGEDRLANFVLDRGFYLSSDLGLFFSLKKVGGGGVSNIQPYVTLKAGFDFNDYIGAEIQLGAGYVSASPASEADVPGFGSRTILNYSMLNMSALVVGALYPTERLAIEPKVGGGISLLAPDISSVSNPDAPAGGTAPHLAFGLDIKYLTLLTDFSAGLSLNGYVYFLPGGAGSLIAFAPAFVVRYTF